MKKIVVVTDFKGNLSETIKQNLISVFENTVNIENVYIDCLDKKTEIYGDCILVMLENRIDRIKSNIKSVENVLVVTRTILEEKALEILNIPERSNVLVVNDYYETALQVTSLLYRLNIKNLNFITYKEGLDYFDCEYAISPDIESKIPFYITNKINLGIRVLDTSTFLTIMSMLSVDEKRIQDNLMRYMDKIVTVKAGMKTQYKKLSLKNEQFKTVIDKISDAVLLFDNEYRLILYNNKAQEIINKKLNSGISAYEVFSKNVISLINNINIEDTLVKINDNYIMITVETINNNHNYFEKLIILKDVTYIKQLEKGISRKMKLEGLSAKYTFDNIVYKSDIMKECIEKAKAFAKSELTVLITGESGTGKELIAQSIHNESNRRLNPFVAINCAALPGELLESELFGYEKGAFTGAKSEGKLGLFEEANHGTIFLDEIGDMDIHAQTKLLRVLQEKQVMHIGSNKISDVDVRVIAATNKDLYREVQNKTFREDLYYRLNVFSIKIPCLDIRREDIIPTFMYFIGSEEQIGDEIKNKLLNHTWKGNVRELKNVADYYSYMKYKDKPLPDVFYDNYDFTMSINKVEIMVLKCINNYTHKNGGIGRNKLLEEIRLSPNCLITEYRLRRILEKLENNEYIDIRMGRNGCKITRKGMDVLMEHDKIIT